MHETSIANKHTHTQSERYKTRSRRALDLSHAAVSGNYSSLFTPWTLVCVCAQIALHYLSSLTDIYEVGARRGAHSLARERYKLFYAIFRCTGISGTMGISCFLACPHFIYTLCQASRRAAVAKSQSHSLRRPHIMQSMCVFVLSASRVPTYKYTVRRVCSYCMNYWRNCRKARS